MGIFISSTYEDLKNERAEVIEIIDRLSNHKAVAMEKFFAENHQSKDVCLKKLKDCGALVLILGYQYGSINEEENISFTEIEYNFAKELKIPIFVFIKNDEKGNWEPKDIGEEKKQKLLDFKSKIDTEILRKTFRTSEELGKETLGAIHNYEYEHGIITTSLPCFISRNEYFKHYMDENKIFNHLIDLIGRKETIIELKNFIKSEKKIAILFGRGGIGKSKILFEFTRNFESVYKDWKLRFLSDGISLNNEVIRQLPAKKCLIVIDNAHQREDLNIILELIHRYPKRFKLILTSRNHGIPYIQSLFTRIGIDFKKVEQFKEIKELNRDELKQLGNIVLRENHKKFLDPLLRVSKDSTLVLVIGGQLIRKNTIEPSLLERLSDFQKIVFNRFEEILIGEVSKEINPELCRKVLSLVAALSPVQLENTNFQKLASEFLKIQPYEFKQIIGILEKNGILFRRGRLLRITPDILSDHILYRACITETEELSGYAEDIFDKFKDSNPEQVLFNIAELDWRINREGSTISLIEHIWNDIETRFKNGTNIERLNILKIIEKVAYFEPSKSLKLVEFVIKNPIPIEEINTVFGLYQVNILHSLAPILRNIAFNISFLEKCCELLWKIGKDDKRSLSYYPDHPISVIKNLAKYDFNKPLIVNLTVLESIEKWLNETDIEDHLLILADFLELFLKKEDFTVSSEGYAAKISPFPVSLTKSRPLREKAIELFLKLYQKPFPKVVLRGFQGLFSDLSLPRGTFGLEITQDLKDKWITEQQSILKSIEDSVKKIKNPLIILKIKTDLFHFSEFNENDESKEIALSIIKGIPETFEIHLNQALWFNYERDWNYEDFKIYEKQVEESILPIVIEFLKLYDNYKIITEKLNKSFSNFQDCGIEPNPGQFLRFLCINNINLSMEICEYITKSPDSMLAKYINSFITEIRKKDLSKAIKLIKTAIKSKSKNICVSIAHGYNSNRWASSIKPKEIKILKKLIKHNERSVQLLAIQSIGNFPKELSSQAIKLLLKIKIGKDDEVANAICKNFYWQHNNMLENIKPNLQKKLLFKFMKIRELNDRNYALNRFLQDCSIRIPEAVIQFIIKRLDLLQKTEFFNDKKYYPYPFSKFVYSLTGIYQSPRYKEFLRKIRDRTCKMKKTEHFWLPIIFSDLSNNFCPESLEVLSEWIDSDDSQKLSRIGLLLRKAPPQILFSKTEFISTLLNKAHSIDFECYEEIKNNLLSIVRNMMKSGIAGQIMPQDEYLRDESSKILENIIPRTPAYQFYEEILKHANDSIKDTILRNEELFGDV
ncbi:MAG: DUF4062 domain-containing protein [Promethearchaeota archaeon]